MTNISVCIISLNEAKHIGACLKACQGFSSDLIVVDSGSTDDTLSIAKKHGARVFEQEWLGYGMQKNIANKHAKFDWILSLDGDEIPDAEMIENLSNCILENGKIYMFKLDDFIGSRKLTYSELRAKWKKRLFNKTEVSWNNRAVHEQLAYSKSIRLEKLQGRISHHSYEAFADFNQKIMAYATLGAKQMVNQKASLSSFKRIFNPYFRFFRSYIMYAGFLEGKLGYQISKTLRKGLQHKYQVYDKLKNESSNKI